MTISYISSAAAASSSISSMPTHAAGDLIVMGIFRDNAVAVPTPAADWRTIFSGGSASSFLEVVVKLAASASETSGTWTNATHMAVAVYRSDKILSAGNATRTSSTSVGAGGNVRYGAISAPSNITNKWHIGVIGHRSNDTDINTAPSGMTNRASAAGGSSGEIAFHDTNGNSSWTSNVDYTLTTGTASAYQCITLELCETIYDISGGMGGGGIMIARGMTGGMQ